MYRGHEFNTSKVEYGRDVSVNIVRLHSAGRTQKRLLFFSFDIFDAQSIKPAATMRNVLIFFFIFLETPHGVSVFTAAVC